MEIKERLKQFIKFKGLTNKEFEETCCIAKGYVSNTRKTMQSDVISTIVEFYPDLNADWLITGRGDMVYDTMPKKNYIKSSDPEPNDTYKYLCEYIEMLKKQVADTLPTKKKAELHM